MLKQSLSAFGMLIFKYRAVLKNMRLKNAAVLAGAALVFCAAPVSAQVGYNGVLYNNFEELRNAGINFNNGDVITVYDSDNSLTAPLDFNGKNVTIDFRNNSVTIAPNTSGRFITNAATVTLANSANAIISGFNAPDDYGGAIYGTSVNISGNGNTFSYNSAVWDGGAIYGESVNISGNGNTFSNNSAVWYGGAIYGYNVNISGNDNTFSNNTADLGGAIYGEYVNISGENIFSYNSADWYGGAISGNFVNISGENTFSNNSAYYGGAIYGNSTNISGNNTFSNNNAVSGGAIFSFFDATISGENTFSNNIATYEGGAIEVMNNLTLIADTGNITFQGNTVSGQANAIYIRNNYDNNTLTLSAQGSNSIIFYDPIESYYYYPNLTISINKNPDDTGTVLFDTYHSKIYGNTTVHNGTIKLTGGAGYGASPYTGVPDVSSFTLNPGATILSDATGNQIRANDITLKDDSVLSFDLTGATESTTNLTLGSQNGGNISKDVIIDIYSLNGDGTFNLVTTNGSVSGENKIIIRGEEVTQTRFDASLDVVGNTLQITTANTQNGIVTWTGDAGDHKWNATSKNWTGTIDGLLVTQFLHGDAVVFGSGDPGEGGAIQIQAQGVQIAAQGSNPGLEIQSGDWEFTGGKIEGDGGLTKNGDGTLTLKSANGYTGGTTINGGILIAEDKGALGEGAVEINTALTLKFDGNFANTFEGTGNLNFNGDIAIDKANSGFSGTAAIAAGKTVTLGNVQALGDNNIVNNGYLNFFYNTPAQKTINIASYSGKGVVGIQAELSAQGIWSDLLNFSTNPTNSVNVHFYFTPGSNLVYMPDSGLHFAYLSAAGGAGDTFRLDGVSSLLGAYQLAIKTDDYQNYYLTSRFNPSLAKVYSEASAAALGHAAGMRQSTFFNSLSQAAEATEAGNGSPGIFAGFGRNDLRYNTGSHADVTGNSVTIALAWQKDAKSSYGIFGQKFTGDYKTSHTATVGGVNQEINSDGSLRYHDIGLFAEYRPNEQKKGDPGHYYQATASVGRSANKFRADNFQGRTSGFDSARNVFGLSIGGGYVKKSGENNTLEYYSHLIYTRLGGDSVIDSIGQNIDFKSSDSLRLLSGARLNFKQNKKSGAYLGAALDYEFSGKADSYINGLKAESANLKGLTGILELGFNFKQSDTLTIDLGLQGYVGKKSGLGGGLTLSKMF